MKIAIFNEFLQTFGGGERSTYAIANALACGGHQVTVVTTEAKLPTQDEINRYFGPRHDGFSLLRIEEKDFSRALRGYDLFINHSSGSRRDNPCARGIYYCMFPFGDVASFVQTYDLFICISAYTERHARYRWNPKNTLVIHPAGETSSADFEEHHAAHIVTVGRFNRQGHDKNQRFLVDAFRTFQTHYAHRRWSMSIIGRVNAGAQDEVERLRAETRDLDVRILADSDHRTKIDVLRSACCYWHGAGVGMSEEHTPELLEHYGISVLEALQMGLPALVFNQGGPPEIIEHGVSGFAYQTREELCLFTSLLERRPDRLKAMQASALTRSRLFDRRTFDGKVRNVIEELR